VGEFLVSRERLERSALALQGQARRILPIMNKSEQRSEIPFVAEDQPFSVVKDDEAG